MNEYGIKVEYRNGNYNVYYNGELVYNGKDIDKGLEIVEVKMINNEYELVEEV